MGLSTSCLCLSSLQERKRGEGGRKGEREREKGRYIGRETGRGKI